MPTADCPFCRIDPRRVVAESDLTLTIRDRFPVSPGHTLVIPRRHFAGLFDATSEEMAEIWQALRHAANGLVAEHRAHGFNVGVNVGAAAGQAVMHLHVHLIPRYTGDRPDPRGGIRRIFPELADYWTAVGCGEERTASIAGEVPNEARGLLRYFTLLTLGASMRHGDQVLQVRRH